MNRNLEIRNFIQDLTDTINNSALSIETKRIVLYMMYTETQKAADAQICKEQESLDKQKAADAQIYKAEHGSLKEKEAAGNAEGTQ